MSDVGSLFNEADKLFDEGKYTEAEQKLLAVLEQDETHAVSHLTLATLYGNVGRADDAAKHIERACQLEPDDPQTFRLASIVLVKAYQHTQNEMYKQKAEDALNHAAVLEHGG